MVLSTQRRLLICGIGIRLQAKKDIGNAFMFEMNRDLF